MLVVTFGEARLGKPSTPICGFAVLFQAVCTVPTVGFFMGNGFLERAMGIEPTSEAWEASILPLYDARLPYKASKSTPRSQVSRRFYVQTRA